MRTRNRSVPSYILQLVLKVQFVYILAYVEVVRIPEGATHIRITETRQSKNYLGNELHFA